MSRLRPSICRIIFFNSISSMRVLLVNLELSMMDVFIVEECMVVVKQDRRAGAGQLSGSRQLVSAMLHLWKKRYIGEYWYG
jgi:hypothetical protein